MCRSHTPLHLLLPRLHPGNGRKQLCSTFPQRPPPSHSWCPVLGVHPSEWLKRTPRLAGWLAATSNTQQATTGGQIEYLEHSGPDRAHSGVVGAHMENHQADKVWAQTACRLWSGATLLLPKPGPSGQGSAQKRLRMTKIDSSE